MSSTPPSTALSGKYSHLSFFQYLGQQTSFIFYAIGVFIFFMGYSYCQEHIGQHDHLETSFMLCFNMFFNTVGAFSIMLYQHLFAVNHNLIKLTHYSTQTYFNFVIISVAFYAAMFFSNFSLKYINFPTLIVAKACKPLSVMFIGILFFKKSLQKKKIFGFIGLSVGIIIFMLNRPAKQLKHDLHYEKAYLIGVSLLLLSLIIDGTYNNFQSSVLKSTQIQPIPFMFLNNGIACLMTLPYLLFSGYFQKSLTLLNEDDQLLLLLLQMALFSVLGQICIYNLLHSNGPLILSVTTTTRKFMSLLFSVWYHAHHLTQMQWVGTCLVFFSLFSNTYFSFLSKQKEQDILIEKLENKQKKVQ